MTRKSLPIRLLPVQIAVLAGFLAALSAPPAQADTLLAKDAGNWRYHKGTTEPSDPRTDWRNEDYDDSAWSTGQAPFGYGSEAHEAADCNTVLGDMLNTYATLFLRKTFAVTDAARVSVIRVGADYDDGFVIWINGEKVCWKNPPDGKPLYDSTASASHEAGSDSYSYLPDKDADFPAPSDFLQEGENTIAVQAFNSGLGSSDFKIDIELVATHKVADTKFSSDRGFYESTFDLTISTATVGATIRYTTDGSKPSASHGSTAVDQVVLTIDTTRAIRAAAFYSDWDPTDVDTQTYIFLDDVLAQPSAPSGFPDYWKSENDGDVFLADYEMDHEIVDDSRYQPNMQNYMKSIPTISIVTRTDDIFGTQGFYRNGGGSGDLNELWEKEVSAELIHPNGKKGFQIDCGIRPRSWLHKKRSFTLLFKEIYGPTKLRYPVFEEAPVNADSATDVFDRLVLRAGANDGWQGADSEIDTYTNDPFERQSAIEMSGIGVHGTFVHLYLNGLYWGQYNLTERPDASFTSEYLGGEKEDWYAGNHGHDSHAPISGDRSRFDSMISRANTDLSNTANYDTMKQLLDVEKYIDHCLIRWYTGMGDWAEGKATYQYVNNYYVGNATTPAGPVKYFSWDGETAWQVIHDEDGTGYKGRANDGAWIKPQFYASYVDSRHKWVARPMRGLARNADFRARFADRLYKHCYNDGAIAEPNAKARWHAINAYLEDAIVCESARWGDLVRDRVDGSQPVYTRHDHWYSACDRIENLMTGNADQLRAACRTKAVNGYFLYPQIDPPGFQQHGGSIGAGFNLTMTNPNGSTGTIYYKKDGSDPRAAGGAKASGALQYGSAVGLTRTTHVRARVYKSNSTWSAAHAATYNYTAHYPNIRITEIMYNPLGGSDYEFVEIRNISGSLTVGLSEMLFTKGIRYSFAPGVELSPGQTVVLARNAAVFESHYGFAPFGQYVRSLDNGGERLTLSDCDGNTVTSVRYNDKDPWPGDPDGDGYSLVFDGTGDQDDPAKWRTSNLIGGSPGYDDGPPYKVVINEVLTHTDLPAVDAIELHNTGSADVDVGGWWLSDSDGDFKKFLIPSPTVLAAGGYVVFDENDFNTDTNDPACFALNSHGDDVFLTHWDASDNLLYLHTEDFGAAENGVAFGRYVRSDGTANFVAQSVNDTLGSPNAGPRIGDVVINEVMYHAPDGRAYDYVEIHNRTAASQPLYLGSEPWKLDGIGYQFPASTTLQPYEYVLVIATNETAFRAKYPSVPGSVRCFGPFPGTLQNNGESARLERPDTPDAEGTPWILVDRVKYNDNSPWPESADGDGLSLERIAPGLYGNDPANWAASLTAGGTPGEQNSGSLISKTAGWRYHDKGADLGTGWRNAGYDDRSWDDGNAPLGYPDTNPDIDTELDFGDDPADKHITTYFRTRFMLGSNPADVTMLKLRVRYDDGYVAYLNGQELARAGMPTGTIGYNTQASGSGSGSAYEEKDVLPHKGKLVLGLNVLAVELHQNQPTSSDIFLDLDLRHAATPDLDPPAGPDNLQAVPLSATEIRVSWADNSDDEAQFKIRWGLSADDQPNEVFLAANTTSWTHSGLAPNTTYHYKVRAQNAAGSSAYFGPVGATTPAPEPPAIAVSTTNIEVSCSQGTEPGSETFQVWNSGASTLDYQISENTSKFSVAPATGSSAGTGDKQTHTITFTTADLAVGVYDRTITVADDESGAGNGPLDIAVRINVLAPAPFTAYNDLCWVDGETTANITLLTTGQSGLLLDHQTGDPTPVTLSVTGGGGPYTTQGAPANAGTDAHTVFDGKVGLNGLVSYAPENLQLAFTGLNNALRYELVLFGNRDRSDYTARTTTVVLSGVEPGFRNQSTAGTTISTTTAANDTTVLGNGYNTVNGHLARYVEIEPGSDGSLLLTVSDYTSKFYANALMLRAAEPAPEQTAIAKASTWRYREGTAEASNPAHAWRATDGFDDSAWAQGAAPFGYGPLSYGTSPDMRYNYPTLFLRQRFTVQNPGAVSSLALDVDYDDGFILWLNGEEIARVNVQGEPGATIAHDQTCTGYVAGNTAAYTATCETAQIPRLQTNNVVAVQLFNNSLGSGDAMFDLCLSVTEHELDAGQDTDGNGLIDDWETAGGTTQPAAVDEDGDGLSNYEEWVAGTAATDPGSHFGVALTADTGNLLVSFLAREAAGTGYTGLQRRYTLESRQGLGAGAAWAPVPGCADILGQGQTVVHTNTAPAPQTVYRGRVWLE